jgi:hypothetical protein
MDKRTVHDQFDFYKYYKIKWNYILFLAIDIFNSATKNSYWKMYMFASF